jgi:hypothetical protein
LTQSEHNETSDKHFLNELYKKSVIRKIRITAADGKNHQIHLILKGYGKTEPQINADERRFVDRDFHQKSEDGKPHCSDLKHPALKHENETLNSTLMTQIKQMFSDPCKSAPSAKSAFYRRTDPRTKSTEGEVSASICVNPRFFYDVTFRTGSQE